MRKWFICMIVSLLVFVAALVLPMKSGLSLLLMVVGVLAATFFGFRFIATRGVIPEIEGAGKKSKEHQYKSTVKEKPQIDSIWDQITEAKTDDDPKE